jgi:hypothetical protein
MLSLITSSYAGFSIRGGGEKVPYAFIKDAERG